MATRLLELALVCLALASTCAAKYVPLQWDFFQDYSTFSEDNALAPGDIVIFSYEGHAVAIEATKEAYDACDYENANVVADVSTNRQENWLLFHGTTHRHGDILHLPSHWPLRLWRYEGTAAPESVPPQLLVSRFVTNSAICEQVAIQAVPSSTGDPHFVGLQGQRYDFQGDDIAEGNGKWYNLVYDPATRLLINARFWKVPVNASEAVADWFEDPHATVISAVSFRFGDSNPQVLVTANSSDPAVDFSGSPVHVSSPALTGKLQLNQTVSLGQKVFVTTSLDGTHVVVYGELIKVIIKLVSGHLNIAMEEIQLSDAAGGVLGSTIRLRYDADGNAIMHADKDGKWYGKGVLAGSGASDYETVGPFAYPAAADGVGKSSSGSRRELIEKAPMKLALQSYKKARVQ
eukprot:jgi/Chlat1/5676/Chrsp37S05472